MDITTALADAKRPEKTVSICFRGDLRAEFEAVEAQLQQMERTDLVAPSLASGGPRRQLAERLEELRQEMIDGSVEFRLRGVGRRAWTQLMADHPPRPDADEDRGLGLNADTFFHALIRTSTVEPALSDVQWDTLLDDTLTSSQFQALADGAWVVNRGSVDIPFSPAASRIRSSSPPE
ncbi:MAG TPA: hypothetical protein VIQ30_08570 [Pseudonocardia sp.]